MVVLVCGVQTGQSPDYHGVLKAFASSPSAAYDVINDCNLEVPMATNLIVRNVDEEVALALKQRAAANGRSAEAEHREILKSALSRPRRRRVADVLASMPNVGQDDDFDVRNG